MKRSVRSLGIVIVILAILLAVAVALPSKPIATTKDGRFQFLTCHAQSGTNVEFHLPTRAEAFIRGCLHRIRLAGYPNTELGISSTNTLFAVMLEYRCPQGWESHRVDQVKAKLLLKDGSSRSMVPGGNSILGLQNRTYLFLYTSLPSAAKLRRGDYTIELELPDAEPCLVPIKY